MALESLRWRKMNEEKERNEEKSLRPGVTVSPGLIVRLVSIIWLKKARFE